MTQEASILLYYRKQYGELRVQRSMNDLKFVVCISMAQNLQYV